MSAWRLGGVLKMRLSVASRMRSVSWGLRSSSCFFGAFAMEPAYHIPLTESELRLIGETCAIQGQIEDLMQQAVWQLLGDLSNATTLKIMGSTSMHTNADIWLAVIKDKCGDKAVVQMAQQVKSDLGEAAKGRNDFVHALFATASPDGSGFGIATDKSVMDGPTVAVRTRTRARRPASDIQHIRDRAARISRTIAHINH